MSQAIYSEFSRYRCLLIVAFSVLALDQLTKNWVIRNLKLDSFESIEVIGDFFYIIHVVNEGAAWGILSGYGWFLIIIALLALVAIYIMRECLTVERWAASEHVVTIQTVYVIVNTPEMSLRYISWPLHRLEAAK